MTNGKIYRTERKGNLNKMSGDVVKTVWGTKGLENKRKLLVDVVSEFAIKKNKERMLLNISKANTEDKLDLIASNIMLCGEDLSTFAGSYKYNSHY